MEIYPDKPAKFAKGDSGDLERAALGFDATTPEVDILTLYLCVKSRQTELAVQSLEGTPDYKSMEVVQMVDAQLFNIRPDLYV